MWDVTDEALVAGVAAGDRDATHEFVLRFQRPVYGCARAIVRDDGRAEDIAQEAFVRAWRHAESFDPRRGSVVAWMLTITRNLAIDALRVERARPADAASTIDLRLVDPGDGPDELADRGGDIRLAQAALRALPVEQRRAVVLATVYGRTAAEVGEIEGIPLGTAKTRIRSGLLRVRAVMRPAVEETT